MWSPMELLGIGGYGTVGSWVQKDENGKKIDEIAIKQQIFDENGKPDDEEWAQNAG